MQPRGLSTLSANDPSLRAARYARSNAVAQPTAIAQHGHGGMDWIAPLVGTLGGIGGGTLGSLVAPGVGTAVGGIAGAAGGQALGQRIEDMLSGHQTTGKEMLGQAALGGGGAVVGGLIGKGVGALGSKLISKSPAAQALAQKVMGSRAAQTLLSPIDLSAPGFGIGLGHLGESGSIGLNASLDPKALAASSSKAISRFDQADNALTKTLGSKAPQASGLDMGKLTGSPTTEQIASFKSAAEFIKARPDLAEFLGPQEMKSMYAQAAQMGSRGGSQFAIEQAMAKGDMATARRLFDALPANSPYRASMAGTSLAPNPSALSDVERLAQGTQRAVSKFDAADSAIAKTLGDESGSIGFNEPIGKSAKTGIAEPLSRSLAGRASQKQGLLLASQYGTIPKKIADQTNPVETFNNLAKAGLTKPAEVESVARGAIDSVEKRIAEVAARAGRVPIQGTPGMNGLPPIRDSIADALELNGVVGANAKSMNTFLNGQLKILAGGPKGNLKPGANPTDTLQVIRTLEHRASNLYAKGYGATGESGAAAEDMAGAYRRIADELKDRLFNAAGANANVAKVLTPELRAELTAQAPNNAKWLAKVDNVMGQKDMPGLRTSIKDLTRGKIIIEASDRNAMTYGARASQPKPLTLGNLGAAVVNSGPVKRAEAGILGAVAGTGAQSVKQIAKDVVTRVGRGVLRVPAMSEGLPAVGYQLGSLMARRPQAQPAEAASGLGSLQSPDLAAEYAADPTNPKFLGVDPAQFGYPEDMTAQPPGGGLGSLGMDQGLTPDLIQNMAMSAIQNSKTMDELKQNLAVVSTLSSLMPKPSTASATSPFGRPSAAAYSEAASGESSLQQLRQMLSENPDLVAKSAVPGQDIPFGIGALIQRGTGTTDYQTALANTLDALIRARTGAVVNKQELKQYMTRFAPRAGDSPQAVAFKLNQIEQAFQPFLDYQTNSQDQTGLSDLFSSQQAPQQGLGAF